MHKNSRNFSQVITDGLDAVRVMTVDSCAHAAIYIIERYDADQLAGLLVVIFEEDELVGLREVGN